MTVFLFQHGFFHIIMPPGISLQAPNRVFGGRAALFPAHFARFSICWFSFFAFCAIICSAVKFLCPNVLIHSSYKRGFQMTHELSGYAVGPLLYCPANAHGSIADALKNEHYPKPFSLAFCLEDTVRIRRGGPGGADALPDAGADLRGPGGGGLLSSPHLHPGALPPAALPPGSGVSPLRLHSLPGSSCPSSLLKTARITCAPSRTSAVRGWTTIICPSSSRRP